jgi:hypothetical protein
MADSEIIKYFNDMLSRWESLFYHEIAGTAIKKVDLIGIDLLQSKKIEGKTVEELVENCIEEITSAGLVSDIKFSLHGYGILLKMKMEGCVHIPKEAKIKQEGIDPYMCPIANMIGDRIIEVLNYEATYMAELKIDEQQGRCTVKYSIFENVDKIGQVSDWTKI